MRLFLISLMLTEKEKETFSKLQRNDNYNSKIISRMQRDAVYERDMLTKQILLESAKNIRVLQHTNYKTLEEFLNKTGIAEEIFPS